MLVFISVIVQKKDKFFLNFRFSNSAKIVYHLMGLVNSSFHIHNVRKNEENFFL